MKKTNKKEPVRTTFSFGKKGIDPREMPLISIEEWRMQENRNFQRIQDVKVCLGFIRDSVEGLKQLQIEQIEEEKWQRYANCDNLPLVERPAEIRVMLEEMRHIEAKHVKGIVNWDLSVDERSLLTQSIYRKDLTHKTLEGTLRPDIGDLYKTFVNRILIILERIEILLASEHEVKDIPYIRILNILNVRQKLSREINALFDKLTYRVVCAPETYRTFFEGVVESYCYKCPDFDIQIWWLRDVPIRFPYLDLPLIVANLDCVDVVIQLPFSVLHDNLTLRCVHTFFDHLSEDAKSFELPNDLSAASINGGIMDIEDCLINEWLMQVNIVQNVLSKIEQKFIEYEEYKRELTVSDLSKKEEDATNKRKQKKRKDVKTAQKPKIKVLKEPERLPEGMLPDPYKIFLEQEENEYKEFVNESLSPKNLNLTPDEINLREYNILGGLYSLDFVRKPKHTNFQKFNVTLHEDGRILYTMEEILANIGGGSDDFTMNKKSGNQGRYELRGTVTQAIELSLHPDLHLQPNEIKYFCLTFRLPQHLCLFGEPLACHFIEDELPDDEHDNMSLTESEDGGRFRKKHKRRQLDSYVGKESSSGQSSQLKGSPRMTSGEEAGLQLLTNIVRRTEMSQSIYQPSSVNRARLTSVSRPSIFTTVQVPNFDLEGAHAKPLTTLQLQHLKRHCMPRILSSFKFPMEFRLQREEEVAEQKTRGCTLVRRQVTDKPTYEEEEPESFSYEKQEAPERFYPLFQKRENIVFQDEGSDNQMDSKTESSAKSADPTTVTLYDVLNTFDKIEDKYKMRAKQLHEQSSIGFKGLRLTTFDAHESSPSANRFVGRQSLSAPKMSSTKSLRGYRSSAETSQYTNDQDSNVESVFSLDGFVSQRKTANVDEYEKSRKSTVKVKHWTTKHIYYSEFSPEACTVKIHTDRLGIFGFGYKCYQHFPFQKWCLQYNDSNLNEIIFTMDTWYVRVILYITNAGIRGYATKIVNEYVADPIKYFEIKEPISDWRELRRRFCEKNINIFAAHDACFYIDKGYFSQKHLASELHVYDAFAVHCKLIKFYRSDWNRLAPRRVILLCLRNPKDFNEGADVTIKVTPEASTFVEVSELCTDNVEIIKLGYQATWRNIGIYSDLHQVINSMYPQATDLRNRDPKLIHNIRTLLTQIRPLSFS